MSVGVTSPGLVLDDRVLPVIGDSEACRPLGTHGWGDFELPLTRPGLLPSACYNLGGRHMEHPIEAVVELVDAPVHEGQLVHRHLGHRDSSRSLGGGPAVRHRLVRPQLDDDVEEVAPPRFAARSGWHSNKAGCFEGGPLPLDDVGNDVTVVRISLPVLEVADAV